MILVDTNVLVYAAGRAHANKRPAASFVIRVAEGEIEAAIDAEVLQEVLHRYRALHRWSEGAEIYNDARAVFQTIFPITVQVTDRARDIMSTASSLSARDAIHAAVVEVYELAGICSFDRDFDRIPGLKRIEP